jgi:hypothetical protein
MRNLHKVKGRGQEISKEIIDINKIKIKIITV